MRVDCALLCDAVTIREGLLHILGGGITRANRVSFPAPLNMSLALRIMVHPTETQDAHKIQVRLMNEDGADVAQIDGEFQHSDPSAKDLALGEESAMALQIGFNLALPKAGAYSFEILIDGVHQTSVPFRAVLVTIDEGGKEE